MQGALTTNRRRPGHGRRARAVEIALLSLAVLSLALAPSVGAVIQGHIPTPMVIQGHSPIVLLVTDPNGYQIGCVAVPCTSTSSPNYVDTIPTAEGPASYDFATNAITIKNPTPGTWTVEYIGTGTGPFTITATTSCSDDKTGYYTVVTGNAKPGVSGSANFSLNPDGTITLSTLGVPQFPMGAGVLLSLSLAALLAVRRLRPLRNA